LERFEPIWICLPRGFGFPKRWVIERGGQSVTYFRHSEKGPFLKVLFKLLDLVGTEQADGIWAEKTGTEGLRELRYLLHFAKMIRLKKVVSQAKLQQPKKPALRVKRKERFKAAIEAHTFKRKFGMPLEFVEEREWRIVHFGHAQSFRKGPASGVPEYYLPYVPGEELFTLVLPDKPRSAGEKGHSLLR